MCEKKKICEIISVLIVLWCLDVKLGTWNLDDYVYIVFSLGSW
jgi:hypothetical protein